MSAPGDSAFGADVGETLDLLASPAARASLEADPYWPKWDSPWWRLLILFETRQLVRAPRPLLLAFAQAIGRHYLPVFPVKLEEIPPGKDPQRDILCFCALGSAVKILHAVGIDPFVHAPWARSWYTRYQLPDGGWNCDEQVYTRPAPRSSVVSTLPMLESLLDRLESLAPDEVAALDRGAALLLDRRVVFARREPTRVADEAWLRPLFPRFYEYDLLRGLAFLVRWSERRRLPLPWARVREVVAKVEGLVVEGKLAPGRRIQDGPRTIRRDASGAWVKGPAGLFPLLESVSAVGAASPWLTAEWREVREGLDRLRARGLLEGEA